MTSTCSPSTSVSENPVAQRPTIQEFSISVPKDSKKKHCVMAFKKDPRIKFVKWRSVKLERENVSTTPAKNEEEIPKFGAGSEFGREAREEARRRKFGMISKKNKIQNHPWILKVNNDSKKKFKGIQQGGFGANVAYYVFVQTLDNKIAAYPLEEWYNFQSIQTYKTLSAEEAEEVMNKKSNVIHYSNLMIQKRLHNKNDDSEDEDLSKCKGKKKVKDLKISEIEDWIDSDDRDDSNDEDEQDKNDAGDDPLKKRKTVIKKKKKKITNDNEAFEDSDDGDDEGRELDYISDSSASETEIESQKEIKSVAEEFSLGKLLSHDEEEDEDEQSDKSSDESGEDEKEKNDKNEEKLEMTNSNENNEKKIVKKEVKLISSEMIAIPLSSAKSLKRVKMDSPGTFQAKRIKTENMEISEDAVRRYLMRKPITTTELLQKFKAKKIGLTREEITFSMTKILKDIKPKTEVHNDKVYFFL